MRPACGKEVPRCVSPAGKKSKLCVDRLYRLAVNAHAFERVGNLKGAAKCYETMVSVRPRDSAAMLRYAKCMRQLGENDIADIAEKRAEELMK